MGKRRNSEVSRRRFLTGGVALGAGALTSRLTGCARSCDSEPSGGVEKKRRIGRGPISKPSHEKTRKPSSNRPNIVYLFSDQHRGDSLGVVGHPVVQTPHLDNLASQGVTFGRCYSNGPLCRPGRTSMMTGLYPHDHGVWHNLAVAPPRSRSHVRRIRDEADYLTAIIGKSHLHKGEDHLDTYKKILSKWGFEHIHELTGPGQTSYIENAYTDWLSATTPEGKTDKYERYKNYIEKYLEKHFKSPWNVRPLDEPPIGLTTQDHLDRYTGRTAAKWIRDYKDKRPFYLQINFPGPHDPFDATGEYRAKYDLEDPKIPRGILKKPGKPVSLPIKIARNFQDITGITAEQQKLLQLAYYAKITLIDEAIGEVVAALKERGLLENTWIVYGSDHGEMLGDHLLVQKGVFYEQAVRVPCIMRPPGGTAGWLNNGLVEQLDVTASLEEIAGLETGQTHGESLVNKVTAGADAPDAKKGKEWVLSECYRHGMVRTDRYKLVANYETVKAVELYDLEADPDELRNRVNDPDLEEAQARLADIMRQVVPDSVWRAKGRQRRRRKQSKQRQRISV
ncbi:MAG: sulfatase-like hydrolase/transferase [Deltaproteobacteria bacterium]|nr:sulfatase-like hydrolase/transferase [Deltaproteobacteria bacterium]